MYAAAAGQAARVLVLSCLGGATMRSLRFAWAGSEPLSLPSAPVAPLSDWHGAKLCDGEEAQVLLGITPRSPLAEQPEAITNVATRIGDAIRQVAVSTMTIRRASEPYWLAGAAYAVAAVGLLVVAQWLVSVLRGTRYRLTIIQGGLPDVLWRIELRSVELDPETDDCGLWCWSRRPDHAVAIADRHLNSLMSIPSWRSSVIVINT